MPSEAADVAEASIFSHDAYPSIERFQTLDGLLQSHAAELNQKPLICYPKTGVDDFEEHTAVALDRYTDAAVNFYMQQGLNHADTTLDKAPVVSLLAQSSFEVIVLTFALNRLGYAILFLSTRLTAPAYARLMEMVNSHMIVHSDAFTRTIVDIDHDRPGCSRIRLLQRNDWFDQPSCPPASAAHDRKWHVRQSGKIAWILHSSGSTGFPKPIYLTNMQCLANFRKSFGMRAFTASPLFHSGGLMELGRAFYTRSTMYLANHSLPVTSSNMLRAISAAKPKLVVAVPYVLKLLAEKEEGVQALAAADLVLFNGSGCPDDLGDRLVAAGVNLVANYGATETGQLMTSYRGIPPTDKEWSYLRLWPPVAEYTLMDEIAPGVFEAVGLDGLPSKGATNSTAPFNHKNPANSFRTADLFSRHPDSKTKGNFYKYLSRLDDRITLVMGEKVLPLPIEGRIRQEDIVREAVVFGFQQALPGVLIFRPTDKAVEMSDAEYLKAVWPAVEAANARAETFSQIMKDLVVIKGAEAEYARTDKGTFIRAQVYQQYDADIQAAYTRFETSGQNTANKLQLDVPDLEDWLLARFRDDLKIPLNGPSSDIFSAGVDSLQTTRIWRSIKQKLDLGPGKLAPNIVFECGTISKLARHLHALRTGETVNDDGDEVEVMQEIIDKYSAYTQHTPCATLRTPMKHTVLLTGATGNLGAFILADLVRRPDVHEICVLVRAQDAPTAIMRTLTSLNSRKILLSVEDKLKLRPVPCDLSQPDLGLGPYSLEHMLNSVTCVIHSAWAVNFNLGVRSFEDQHIRGTHNLINFCLRSRLPEPAKFFFCSSVSTASSTPKPATIPERTVSDLRHAMKTGYGRSKLVAEHITVAAAKKTGLHARVLRIGQLSGDTKAGIWNDTEAIPLMIRSALVVGALPALDERPSWLPVDVCAEVVVALALPKASSDAMNTAVHGAKKDGGPSGGVDPADEPEITNTTAIHKSTMDEVDTDLVYHILNPHTFSFRNDLLPTLQKLSAHQQIGYPSFDVISSAEWLQRLEASDPNPATNPSIKLLDFWKGKYGSPKAGTMPDDEASMDHLADEVADKLAVSTSTDESAGLTFETTRTVRDCPMLGEVRDPVSEGLMEKYVGAWMAKWRSDTMA
ncbi:hypothetical protein LTR91_013014 [Friedmanniomyces endolithicus]|uniref:Carrier domain-containing protein n=1 Tax=Friedmanniomyces endolithicus TaxID=329885 RepID=A0AAN6QPY4_9PEZI|nr:hypothetical protein LTR57_020137 [Friedmanniomyces endolithicus]KAK0978209.1 hypothetical protein LTR91_013014 [Friedmanniomyces endolithicus]KAK0991963.1 hypothetical protein LTS01_008052 [Friedmanniomyces endolithicus]